MNGDAVLLDTNVASFLLPSKGDSPQRRLYEPHLRDRILVVSVQVTAEMFRWADENDWGVRRRRELDEFIDSLLVVPHDVALSRTWALVMSRATAIGRRLEAGDGWIAATAVARRLTLVTHDRDFVGLGVAGLDVVCHAGATP